MSIEELADQEVKGALERQAKDEERKEIEENEHSSDEEVSERERYKTAAMENWKDDNPKGRGNTKRI